MASGSTACPAVTLPVEIYTPARERDVGGVTIHSPRTLAECILA